MLFDQPETITRLGEKVFTRIKDEKGQRVTREILAQRLQPTAHRLQFTTDTVLA